MENSNNVVKNDLVYIYNGLSEELACLSGKRLLITGGAGFLGYYLIQALLYWNKETDEAQHIQLTIHDNFARGVPEWLTNLRGDKNLSLIKQDVTHPLPKDIEDFQYIIHAASIASPIYYRKHPIETMDANVNGLRILLEYCLEQKRRNKSIEGFLFFSTSEIYGDPPAEYIPTPETYRGYVSCTGPRACYDESKRYGETLCVNFAGQHDLPIKIARPFNNYGPGLKITDRRVLPDFAREVLAGRDITLLSDGTPTRTFCYIADAIVGYYKVLVNGWTGESYNIGTEKPEISMLELAERMAELAVNIFGYKGKVIKQISSDKQYLTDSPNRRCPMIAKARRDLGYNPSISIDEGLKRSLIWYFENQNAEEA